MAIDHVKIPQDIHVEDKIIGPLSMRQLGLVAGGGAFSYALFAGVQKSLGYVPLFSHFFIWLPLLICGAYALVKVNNLSLFRLTLLVIETQIKPKQRVWVPRRGLSLLVAVPDKRKIEDPKKEEKDRAKEKTPSIEDLAGVLDTEGGVKRNVSAMTLSPAISAQSSPTPAP